MITTCKTKNLTLSKMLRTPVSMYGQNYVLEITSTRIVLGVKHKPIKNNLKKNNMTVTEFSNKTSELIKMHPNQSDLLCIATTDAFDEEDESPMLDELMNWCLEVCANNVTI